jgi:hypothetical protein
LILFDQPIEPIDFDLIGSAVSSFAINFGLFAVTLIGMLRLVRGRRVTRLGSRLCVAADQLFENRGHSTLEFGGRMRLPRIERLLQGSRHGLLSCGDDFFDATH